MPRSEAASLLPLVERALSASSTELKQSLMRVVENSLARRAQDRARKLELEHSKDYESLKAVAQVLHTWEPTPET